MIGINFDQSSIKTGTGSVKAISVEAIAAVTYHLRMPSPFRYFNSSPEVIRLAVMMYVRYPLSLRQIEELLFERGMSIPAQNWSVSRRDIGQFECALARVLLI